jgi:hypothetical protein
MECEKCNAVIDPGEEREHFGKMLCEDCYSDHRRLSTRIPWSWGSVRIEP